MEKPLSGFKTLHGNKPYKTTYATIKRSYTSSENKRSNRSGRFLLPKTSTNRYKAAFQPDALFVFNEHIIVINRVHVRVQMSFGGDRVSSLRF